jgi:hypothetical protein
VACVQDCGLSKRICIRKNRHSGKKKLSDQDLSGEPSMVNAAGRNLKLLPIDVMHQSDSCSQILEHCPCRILALLVQFGNSGSNTEKCGPMRDLFPKIVKRIMTLWKSPTLVYRRDFPSHSFLTFSSLNTVSTRPRHRVIIYL